MKLPKINIGIKSKRNFFDLSHDVSTTCDFGFCQPTIVQSLIPKSKINVKTSSFLRLAPMPCPTFGRVKVQTDNVFVSTRDIQLNIDSMLSGANYVTPFFSGSCETSDFISANRLFWSLIRQNELNGTNWSQLTPLIAPSIFVDGSKNLFNQIFRFSFSTNQDLLTGAPREWHDLQVDYESFGLSNTSRRNYLRFIEGLLHNHQEFFNVLSGTGVSLYDALGLNSTHTTFQGSFFSSGSYVDYLHSFIRPVETLPFYDRYAESEMSFTSELQNVVVAYNNMSSAFRKFFDSPVTSENADFSFQWAPNEVPIINGFEQENFEFNATPQTTTHDDAHIYWRLNFQLTPFGRKLFKIFNACHFNFRQLDYKIELNKLFAYYKAWFDLYNPGRTMNWEYTSAYKLIHCFYDYPQSLDYNIVRRQSNTALNQDYRLLFKDFLYDLVMCNYYLDTDNITVATRLPAQYVNGGDTSMGTNSNFGGYPVFNSIGDSAETVGITKQGVTLSSPTFLSALSVKMLERLYNFVNRESVLGSNIAEILRTKYGIDVRQSIKLGSSNFYCQISDIMGTVNNDETALGEYAGRGIGSGDDSIKFETGDDQFGYFIQLVTVVPLGGYVQASEHPLINRYDYYTEDFDSLGYEPLPMSEVLGRESIINNFGSDTTFGFRPRYFNLKFKNNLNNGGFSFRSQRGSFLPYALDRLFSEGDYNDFSTTRPSSQYGTVTYGNYKVNPPVALYPLENLRSIGLYETFGNYDRIFYDTSGASDNFILHQVHDFAYYAPMKAVADSFDTVNDEVHDDVTKTEHE